MQALTDAQKRAEDHLNYATEAVATWPEWKQSCLGGVPQMQRRVTLTDWINGGYVKTATIVRKNGRIGVATRLDWPLLRIMAQRAVWRDYGKTCVFLNDFYSLNGVHARVKPSEAWQMVIVTKSKIRRRKRKVIS